MEKNLKTCLEKFFKDDKSEKVIFIGAGFSKNLGLPSWEEFAYMHLDFLRDNNKINFETTELLRKDDFRTVISISRDIINRDSDLKEKIYDKYKEIFMIDYDKGNFINLHNNKLKEDRIEKLNKIKDSQSIFSKVYNLGLINVTTNYDDILDILANQENKDFINKNTGDEKNKYKKVFYKEEDFKNVICDEKSVNAGEVYHIHGSINDINSMIVSNEDYIERYWTGENSFKKFIKKIFDEYNVIFLGYSLQELEILNYLFEKKKGPLQKTDKQRILILDCFDYEKKKFEFLKGYYYENYKIKLCPYSKSQKGFKALTDVVDTISDVKKGIESEKKNYSSALALIQKSELEEKEVYELLEKLKVYQDLQSAFFKKIRGEYKYLKYISKSGYFKREDVNVVSLMNYLNSLHSYIEDINNEDIDDLYKIINKDLDKYILEYDFIIFLFKYSTKIDNFNLENLFNSNKKEEFEVLLINNILNEINQEYIFNFFVKNEILLSNLLCKCIFRDNLIIYRISKGNRLLEYIIENEDLKFINNFIKRYEKIYLKDKYENEKFKINVGDDTIIIQSKNNTFNDLKIKFTSLEEIYNKVDSFLGENSEDVKKGIVTLFNDNSYSSFFDNKYLLEDKKTELLIKIFNITKKKEDIIEKLFKSKVYYLKKLALYLIVENKMIDFIIKKVNNEDFDLEYIIRNSEFSGELKEIFKLLNNSEKNKEINSEFLLSSIQKGKYFVYQNESEEDKIIWCYKRFKELRNFECINIEFKKLKAKVKYDYELTPLVGRGESGWVKSIPMIDEQSANKMDIYAWIDYMNNYKKKKHKEFLIEYSIKEDVKIFIKCMRRNIDSYMRDFKFLSNVNNYEWIYYIFCEINDILKSEDTIFNFYYEDLFRFVKIYLYGLSDIYEELKKHYISKKYLVSKICEVLTCILRKEKLEFLKFKDTYKELIEKLEELISDGDDFKKIFENKNDNIYISFINSVHKNLLELEIVFLLKLKNIDLKEDNNKYIRDIILARKNKSPKEFYIFFGNYLSTYMTIDKNLAIEIINNININNDKELFLIGFSQSRVINEEQYNLIKPIIIYMNEKKLEGEYIIDNLVQYYTLAYLLDYKNSELDIINKKHNLTRESIFAIFNLKESYKNLCDNYDEKVFERKVKEIWNELLNVLDDNSEQEIVEATIEAVENFKSIDRDIVNNIKSILKFVQMNAGLEYKLCNYLKRVLCEENLNNIIECMKYYKSDDYNSKMIELCKEVEKVSMVKFDEFKNYWLLENKGDSQLRSYLLRIDI